MRLGRLEPGCSADASFPERYSEHRDQESEVAAVAINGGEVPALTPYCKTSDIGKAPQQDTGGQTSLRFGRIGEWASPDPCGSRQFHASSSALRN